MDSVWKKEARHISFDALKGNKTTDALIVGGGIAGILCAYKLKNAGVDCILAEAGNICGGVTQNTTAKITLGHGLIYYKLIKRFGEEKARLYLEAQTRAGKEYADLCRNIDCGFEIKDSYVYSLNNRRKIEREIAALHRLGAKAEFSDADELPFKVAGAVRMRRQAQFHPLKFLYTLAKGLPIYENTKVTEFLPNKVVTNHGSISFRKLIVTTHFPIFNKHGWYFIKLYQHRSYVLALRGAQSINGMYVDESETGLSFRTYGDLLLLGGGGHRTGKQGGCWQELEAFAEKAYPNSEIVSRWATQDCMTLDGVPYIGRYSASTPDVYVATGFNKWGMTNAMVAADILCDLVMEKQNPYAEVFSPSRSILHPQLAINAFESTVGLLTPTAPRCPHLGCALKYNRAERTWDCPCHGSRFSENGEVIDNPATDDNESIGK
ncbi:MAG: FAD-dependent oxidoreductase [Oscillospiraceae bacterium]|nr:FAD-dependent oxidoreductase [Oscillospiraceae bacterium]